VLDAKLEALAEAFDREGLEGDVPALREALHQLVGRPTDIVQGNADRPIRIVVESISSRRREQLEDGRRTTPRSRSCLARMLPSLAAL
jgi:hypothetical protein